MKPNNFYNVIPFVQDLLNFVKKEKAKKGKKDKKKVPSPVQLTHAVSNPIMIPNQAFTGESFLKHIFSFGNFDILLMCVSFRFRSIILFSDN